MIMQLPKMTLQDCYIEHSYYFLSLKENMRRIVDHSNLNGLGTQVIETFPTAFGNLPLNSLEEYRKVLDMFQSFVAGVAWTLEQQ